MNKNARFNYFSNLKSENIDLESVLQCNVVPEKNQQPNLNDMPTFSSSHLKDIKIENLYAELSVEEARKNNEIPGFDCGENVCKKYYLDNYNHDYSIESNLLSM